MKKIVQWSLILFLVIGMLGLTSIVGCKEEAAEEAAPAEEEVVAVEKEEEVVAEEKEVYVWANACVSLPYFVHNDWKGLDAAEKDLGVIVKKIGPEDVNIPALIEAIEAEIAKKPAGMCTVGWDPSVQVAIDKAVDAGIPFVTVDTDVPGSKRFAYIGSDWYTFGRSMAEYVYEALGEKYTTGKIASIGQLAAPYNVEESKGFEDAMTELNPDIELLGTFDDEHNPQKIVQIATDLINANPDLFCIVGFDSLGVAGIATAIRETGKEGEIWTAGIGNELENLQAVKDGIGLFTMWPNAKLRTYYAIRLLYDYNHTTLSYTKTDEEYGIRMIPKFIDCGIVKATPESIDDFIESSLAAAEEE